MYVGRISIMLAKLNALVYDTSNTIIQQICKKGGMLPHVQDFDY